MTKPLLIIPVENQVRELDAKLLLACVAAKKGYRSVIGFSGAVDLCLGRFPRGIYVSKSAGPQNLKYLRLNCQLGNKTIGWDEEALEYLSDEVYANRLQPGALDLVDHYIAWGEDNKRLIQNYRHLPEDMPIHVLGNPRADLLRSECRSFFEKEVSALKEQYGDYILINTNFPRINHYDWNRNVANPDSNSETGFTLTMGRTEFPARFTYEMYCYAKEVFKNIQTLVCKIVEAHPERKIILRPHPTENDAFWEKIAEPYPNFLIRSENNVLPWLLGCSVLIHNGCTTAVEGYGLDTPIITYDPVDDSECNTTVMLSKSKLPNRLGEICTSDDAVLAALQEILPVHRQKRFNAEQDKTYNHYIHKNPNALASEDIMDIADTIMLPEQNLWQWLLRFYAASKSQLWFRVKTLLRATGIKKYNYMFMHHRFPKLSVEIIEDKTARLCKIIGAKNNVQIKQLDTDIFEIS